MDNNWVITSSLTSKEVMPDDMCLFQDFKPCKSQGRHHMFPVAKLTSTFTSWKKQHVHECRDRASFHGRSFSAQPTTPLDLLVGKCMKVLSVAWMPVTLWKGISRLFSTTTLSCTLSSLSKHPFSRNHVPW